MDWEHHHYVNSAEENHEPYWPTDSRTETNPGTWREGGASATYYTYVEESSGKTKKREMDENEWKTSAIGDAKTGKKAWLYGVWYGFD